MEVAMEPITVVVKKATKSPDGSLAVLVDTSVNIRPIMDIFHAVLSLAGLNGIPPALLEDFLKNKAIPEHNITEEVNVAFWNIKKGDGEGDR
jgi:hypothetical protein